MELTAPSMLEVDDILFICGSEIERENILARQGAADRKREKADGTVDLHHMAISW